MQFCEKCKAVLVTKKEGNKISLICRKCGHRVTDYKPVEISEIITKKPLDDIIIIEKKEEALPKTKAICPKCGNREAVWWLQQTRSADEAPTLFLRCIRCNHSWKRIRIN